MKVLNMMTTEDIKRIKAQTDLPLLIKHYKKEIWEWKQKESQWLSDKNLLAGSKQTIEEIANKLVEISKDNYKTEVDLFFTDIWGMKYKSNDEAVSHDHFPAAYSLVYYIDVPKDCPAGLIFSESLSSVKIPIC